MKKFLLFFSIFAAVLWPGFSIAQAEDSAEVQSLDRETQELICVANTSILETQDICLKDKVSVERVAVCSLYTSTHVSEGLCLKNRVLSSEDVLKCSINTSELIEQICLVGSETSARAIDHFETADGDLLKVIEEIKQVGAEMENILSGYKVRFYITKGAFGFHNE